MQKTIISATILDHTITNYGEEALTILGVFPRIVLAEVNTHKMLGKNTSSSRAIPFHKMVEVSMTNPFIPIAFQKHHKGMQGSEYLLPDEPISLEEITHTLGEELKKLYSSGAEEDIEAYKKLRFVLDDTVMPLLYSDDTVRTPLAWWLKTRDLVVAAATIAYSMGMTKQLANRLIEPFTWVTDIITGPVEHGGWMNFFELRCPRYEYKDSKSLTKGELIEKFPELKDYSVLEWLAINKTQAEIHIAEFAEKALEAYLESTPRLLQPGEWHNPYRLQLLTDRRVAEYYKELEKGKLKPASLKLEKQHWEFFLVKLATALIARVSYTVVGGDKDMAPERMFKLQGELLVQNPPHSSPTEHCLQAMTTEQRNTFIRGTQNEDGTFDESSLGWSKNMKGFIPYRYFVEQNINH